MKSPPDEAGLAKIASAHALSNRFEGRPLLRGYESSYMVNNMIPIVVNMAIGSFLSADQRGNGVGGGRLLLLLLHDPPPLSVRAVAEVAAAVAVAASSANAKRQTVSQSVSVSYDRSRRARSVPTRLPHTIAIIIQRYTQIAEYRCGSAKTISIISCGRTLWIRDFRKRALEIMSAHDRPTTAVSIRVVSRV